MYIEGVKTLALAAILVLTGTPVLAQTISRTPAGPPRPVAIARKPAPAPAKPPRVQPSGEFGGYHPGWLANYGGYPLPYAVATYAQQAPPPPIADVSGPQPGPAMAFIGGHYQWSGAGYNWLSGRWVAIPAGYTQWVAGRWVQNHLGWYWINGYWA